MMELLSKKDKALFKTPSKLLTMRGFFNLQDSSWSGEWAMTAKEFTTGPKGAFEYQRNHSAASQLSTESSSSFVSDTVLEGWFTYKEYANGQERQIQESAVLLRFFDQSSDDTTIQVQGTSVNEFGSFLLFGVLNVHTGFLQVEKTMKSFLGEVKEEVTPLNSRRKRQSVSTDAELNKLVDFTQLVQNLSTHDVNGFFLYPVVDVPGYFEKIKQPMDFGTIRARLDNNEFASVKEAHEAVSLVFSNSRKFNTDKGTTIYGVTATLSKMFDKEFLALQKSWGQADHLIVAEESSKKQKRGMVESEEESDEGEYTTSKGRKSRPPRKLKPAPPTSSSEKVLKSSDKSKKVLSKEDKSGEESKSKEELIFELNQVKIQLALATSAQKEAALTPTAVVAPPLPSKQQQQSHRRTKTVEVTTMTPKPVRASRDEVAMSYQEERVFAQEVVQLSNKSLPGLWAILKSSSSTHIHVEQDGTVDFNLHEQPIALQRAMSAFVKSALKEEARNKTG